jgi:hypothetical protein
MEQGQRRKRLTYRSASSELRYSAVYAGNPVPGSLLRHAKGKGSKGAGTPDRRPTRDKVQLSEATHRGEQQQRWQW